MAGSSGSGLSANFWLVKTNNSGNMEWNQTYGGSDYDFAHSLVETSDGGFAIVGYTGSFGAGNANFWLVKTDGCGNMEWNQTYGIADYNRAYSLVQTSDGGLALAGSSGSGFSDFWLIKTDKSGIIPEFPSWVILPLFLIATLFSIIIRKRLFSLH